MAAATLGEEGKKVVRLLPPIEQKEAWQPAINEAGNAVGQALKNLGLDAAELAEKGSRSPRKPAVLRLAAFQTRFLDAAEVGALPDSPRSGGRGPPGPAAQPAALASGADALDYWALPDPAHPSTARPA